MIGTIRKHQGWLWVCIATVIVVSFLGWGPTTSQRMGDLFGLRRQSTGVGMLAGFMASSAAMGVGWAMAHFAFEFNWTAAWYVPFAGALAGGLLAWAAGWWGLAGVLKQPVSQTLRQAAL